MVTGSSTTASGAEIGALCGGKRRTRALTRATRRAGSVRFVDVRTAWLDDDQVTSRVPCTTVRGDAADDSDVDLFFDHPEGSLGLFELMDVKETAARILGCKTDIMTRRSLHPVLRGQIEASALQVF